MRKLIEWLVKDSDLLKELRETVIGSIERAAKLRNTLLHAEWGIATEYPDALILKPIFGHQMAYSEADLNEAIDRIVEARKVLVDFELKVRKLRERNEGA